MRLLGTDRRGAAGGTNNTDTLLLFHLDPNARRLVVLSVPRDLYVEIPGHGQDRVNAAYAWGEQDGTGGLALARQAVGQPAQEGHPNTVLALAPLARWSGAFSFLKTRWPATRPLSRPGASPAVRCPPLR